VPIGLIAGNGHFPFLVLRAARQLGHEVTVVHDADSYTSLGYAAPAATALDDGVEVITLRSSLGALSVLLTHQFGRPVVHRAEIAALLAQRQFDVVHFHNVSLVGGPGLFALARGAVTVYTAHEHWLVCPTHVLWRHGREPCTGRECIRCSLRSGRPPQLWRSAGLLERSLPHVDTFIALSEFSRQKHREFGFPRDMEVLPPIVFEPAERDRFEAALSSDLRVATARYPTDPSLAALVAGLLEHSPRFADLISKIAG